MLTIREPRTIVVGTRQSMLALTQTGQVIEHLKQLCQEYQLPYTFEIRKIVTKGDQILDVTLSKVGGKGLFVKEIEEALLSGDIDLAVHSMKDMPAQLLDGLMNGATPRRVDVRDALISSRYDSFAQLPHCAKVGTSSLRRAAQLKQARPDLDIVALRGNIDTRLRKLDEEGFDAIVLAAAGLQRMQWSERVTELLSPELCVPAVGQGALGIECRIDDSGVRELLALYNDATTAKAVQAERSFLASLNGGCQVPIGAYATVADDGETVTLTGLVAAPDGSEVLRLKLTDTNAEQLGLNVAEQLRRAGAEQLLRLAEHK